MYPSQARMFLAPIRTQAAAQRVNDFQVGRDGCTLTGWVTGVLSWHHKQLPAGAVGAYTWQSTHLALTSRLPSAYLPVAVGGVLDCRTPCTAGLSSSRR